MLHFSCGFLPEDKVVDETDVGRLLGFALLQQDLFLEHSVGRHGHMT